MADSQGNLSLYSAVSTASLKVDHSAFRDSLGWGIYVPCGMAGQTGAMITIDDTTSYVGNALGSRGPGPRCP